MDPYVIGETRMQRMRTATMMDAGKEVQWPDEFMEVDVKYIGDDLHLAVMDENVTDSDLVGETVIKLSALCVNGGLDEWFEIQYKGKKAGDVHLKGTWEPKGEELTEKPKVEEAPRPELTFIKGGAVAPPVNFIPTAVIAQAPQYYQQHYPQQVAMSAPMMQAAYPQVYQQYPQMQQPMMMQ